MRSRRDIVMVGGLFVVLVAFVLFGPGRFQQASGVGGATSHSSQDDGALALYTWIRALGYDGERLEYQAFTLDEDVSALFILNPTVLLDRSHARMTLEWVERGGTLVLAEDSSIVFGAPNALFDELDVDLAVYSTTMVIEQAQVMQPTLDQPPVAPVLVRTGYRLLPRRDDFVPLVGVDDAVVVAGRKYGAGYVYVSAAVFPFTNAGLRHEANAALVLNLLRRVPLGGRIEFDEYHQGFFAPPSSTTTFLSTPWGWASGYAVVVVALFLILSGRRFGRPVPLQEEVVRRSSAEFVESMATLFQRGGKRDYILRHYHSMFKRRVARAYGVSSQLDDVAFVRELARVREVDEVQLLSLLGRLGSAQVSEAEVVRVVAEAEVVCAMLLGTA